MNKEHVVGGIKEVKGKIKEEVGHAVGSEKTASEGVIDQVAGRIQEKFGDVKDAVKGVVDRVLEKKTDSSSDKQRSA